MSFWVLLLRILVLVLSFLVGGFAKDRYDYHYKKLPLLQMPCKCKCDECKCNKGIFPLLRRTDPSGPYAMTQAELDQLADGMLWGFRIVDDLPPEHGWTPPSEREQKEAEGLLP